MAQGDGCLDQVVFLKDDSIARRETDQEKDSLEQGMSSWEAMVAVIEGGCGCELRQSGSTVDRRLSLRLNWQDLVSN